MVYCGKPSKGCGECRSRKIRCDQVRPKCSQCVRANRDCPGYRDQLSLMFRDESKDVIRKATAATRRKSKGPKRTSRPGSPSGNDSLPERQGLTVDIDLRDIIINIDPLQCQRQAVLQQQQLLSLPNPTQGEAAYFLIHSQTSPIASWMMNNEVASPLVSREGSFGHQAMMASMASVGMAMLSRIRNSPSMKVEAEHQYGSALKLVNAALSDKVEAKTHSTLTAVLLLAMFEVVTSRNLQDIQRWTNHADGAVALLELRGVEQFQDQIGTRLFFQWRSQIVVSCLQKNIHVPPFLLECPRAVILSQPQTSACADALLKIIAKVANLRADMKFKIIIDGTEILSTASMIDAELTAWLATVPPGFSYTTVELPAVDNTWFTSRCRGLSPYSNQYHVYADIWICAAWNYYRCARILIGEVIATQLKRLSEKSPSVCSLNDFQTRYRNVHATLRQTAIDVCCSVPFCFGAAGTGTGTGTGIGRTVKPKDLTSFVPDLGNHVGGMILLWPLVLAGIVEGAGHPLRKYTIHALKLIGNTMGISQALALMDALESDLLVFGFDGNDDDYDDCADAGPGASTGAGDLDLDQGEPDGMNSKSDGYRSIEELNFGWANDLHILV